MNKKIFITGIGTDVGKTIASAIVCESLQADYWKPIQAGDIEHGDKHTVASLISNKNTKIHPNTYALSSPMSPHAAAEIDGVIIKTKEIITPVCDNHLVTEGAGGLLVPINDHQTILDLISPEQHVIVVSRHYLGSINHSLLTIKLLQQRGFNTSVIFIGEENTATESIIHTMTNANIIGRINEEKTIDSSMVKRYATEFKQALLSL